MRTFGQLIGRSGVGIALVATLGLGACDKKADPPPAPAPAEAVKSAEPAAKPAEPAAKPAEEVAKPAEEVAKPAEEAAKPGTRSEIATAYEALRDALAHDNLETTKTAAQAVKAAATAGAFDAALATQADAVAAAADLDVARTAFGELSKAFITLLAAKPELAGGPVFTYRCPMAEGYQKWVQVEEAMANPYMGQKMLECGSKVELVP